MRKCYYIWDKIAGKVLIPGCWSVAHTNDMSQCTCRDRPPETFKQFERKEFREKLLAKNVEIKELEKEVSQLNRIIKKLFMIFARGKFYEGGMEVPLEFGNKQQSNFLDKIRELEGDGILSLSSTVHTCTCGEQVTREEKNKGTCWKCGNVFKWCYYKNDDNILGIEIPIIKLIHREK